MKNILTKFSQFISGLFDKKNLLIFILTAVVVILILLNLKSCSNLKEQKAFAQQNEEAIKNELVVEKNKSGFYQTSIAAYEGKVKDVEKYSEDLSKEIKDLKNRKPKVIIKTEIVYIGDTTTSTNTLVDNGNGNYDLNWDFINADSSRILKGTSSFNAKAFFLTDKTYSLKILPGTTSILHDELRMDFIVGIAKNKKTGLNEIFVTPKNPNVHVGKLEGAILNESKPKKFSLSAQLGYGIIYGKQNLTLGPYIGIGISYNLIQGLFK